jgi:hypothetical protein
MDGSDKPSMAWTDGGLNFSAKSGTKWSTTVLDRDNVIRQTPPPSLFPERTGDQLSLRVQ